MLEAIDTTGPIPVEVRPMQLGELAGAYIKAKAKMEALVKKHKAAIQGDRSNFSYSYANLADALDVCEGPFGEEGIAVFSDHEVMVDDKGATYVYAHTTLYHAPSNQYRVAGYTPVYGRNAKPDARELGSMITYARKYSLLTAAGLASEDDDAEAASRAQSPDTSAQRAPARQNAPATINSATKAATKATANLASAVAAPAVDTALTDAQNKLTTAIAALFDSNDLPNATKWLVNRYTKGKTPASVRASVAELTIDEANELVKIATERQEFLTGEWAKHLKAPVAA